MRVVLYIAGAFFLFNALMNLQGRPINPHVDTHLVPTSSKENSVQYQSKRVEASIFNYKSGARSAVPT